MIAIKKGAEMEKIKINKNTTKFICSGKKKEKDSEKKSFFDKGKEDK
jgi:hypothetical protein